MRAAATVLVQRRSAALRSRVLSATLSQQGYLFPSSSIGSNNQTRSRSTLVAQPSLLLRDRLVASSVLPSTLLAQNSQTFTPWRFKSSSAPSTALKKDEEEEQAAAAEDASPLVKSTKTQPGEWLYDLGLPSLIPEWKKMLSRDSLFTDISAGLTVGCIAVPLSLAIALASGVPAEVGLVTAAVSGVAGGLLGGTTLAVTGPAAAISLLVVGAVQEHGLEALPFITLACGGLQMASGVTRLGVVAKLVPVSVIAGFTTGVGSLILTGQLPKALGMSAPAGLSPVELVSYLGSNVALMSPSSAALAVGTSAAMFMLPKLHPKVPSALVAVGGATLATHTLGLDVSLIGSIPSGLEAFQFGLPALPSAASLPSLSATVLLIYAMTSVESLLSCAALEKMKKTSYKHNPDQELIGQGLANVGSAMFMGMPVTSVIARSSLNVRLNANTRLPALVQAGFVFSSVVFLSDKIAMIPMPALSGVLITTGLGMLNPAEFQHCYAVDKMDVVPFVTTIGGMLSLGLAEGIGLGCASAVAQHLMRSSGSLDAAKMKVSSSTMALPGMPQLNVIPATNQDVVADKTNLMAHHDMMYPASQQHAHDRGVHTAVRSPSTAEHDDMSISTDSTTATVLTTDAKTTSSSSTTAAVWQLHGPISFISMFEIDDLARRVQERLEDASLPAADTVVLDMQDVSTVEFTGMEELVMRLLEVSDNGMDAAPTPVQMINCNEAVRNALDQCDPKQQIQRFPPLLRTNE